MITLPTFNPNASSRASDEFDESDFEFQAWLDQVSDDLDECIDLAEEMLDDDGIDYPI